MMSSLEELILFVAQFPAMLIVHHFGLLDFNISVRIRWSPRKLCMHIHGPQRMNPPEFTNPLTRFCSSIMRFTYVL